MGAGRRCRAAYGVLRRPDRGRHRLEPVQVAAKPRGVTLPGRGDRLLGCPGEPLQPHPQERPGTRIAAVDVSQRGPAGGPGFSHDSAGCLAHLGRGRRQLAFAAREHPQPQQVRLAALLMIQYLLGGSHGNHCPSGVRGSHPMAAGDPRARDYGPDLGVCRPGKRFFGGRPMFSACHAGTAAASLARTAPCAFRPRTGTTTPPRSRPPGGDGWTCGCGRSIPRTGWRPTRTESQVRRPGSPCWVSGR